MRAILKVSGRCERAIWALVMGVWGIACATPVVAQPTNGLVLYCPFDNNAADAGPAHHPVSSSGNPVVVQGRMGGAMQFDGMHDYLLIQHGGALSFDPDVTSFSYAFWAWIDPAEDQFYFMQERWGENLEAISLGGCMSCGTVSTGIVWYNGSQGHFGAYAQATGTQHLAGSWHHFAFVFERRDAGAGTLALYIDGVASGSAERLGSSFNPPPAGLVVGAGQNIGVGNYFKGKLDELRVYNRALSSGEVQQLAGVPGEAAGLIAYLPLNGTAADLGSRHFATWAHPGVTFGNAGGVNAAHFSGTGEYISVEHNGALTFDPNYQSYALAMWVRADMPVGFPYGDVELINDRTAAYTTYNLTITSAANPRPLMLGTNTTDGTCHSVVEHQLAESFFGVWRHVAVVYEAGTRTKTLYVDGNPVGATVYEGCTVAATPNPLTYIGAGNEHGVCAPNLCVQSFFKGDMREVRVYNRALTRADVSRLVSSSHGPTAWSAVSNQWASRVQGVTGTVANPVGAVGPAGEPQGEDALCHLADGAGITLAFDQPITLKRGVGNAEIAVWLGGAMQGRLIEVQVASDCGQFRYAGTLAGGEQPSRTAVDLGTAPDQGAAAETFHFVRLLDVQDGQPMDVEAVEVIRPDLNDAAVSSSGLPPSYSPLPVRSGSGVRNLTIVTHGWNGLGGGCEPALWVDNLAQTIQQRMAASETWDVRGYHWENYAGGAGPSMGMAVYQARNIGRQLGDQIVSDVRPGGAPGYEHVHVIAHSAGSWIAREIAGRIKQSGLPISVHVTLLDPYDPNFLESPSQNADFCDTYFVNLSNWGSLCLEPELPFTGAQRNTAYNVDLTDVYPCSAPAGDFGATAHAYPCTWYTDSWPALGDPVHPFGTGLGLSKEFLASTWDANAQRQTHPYNFGGVAVGNDASSPSRAQRIGAELVRCLSTFTVLLGNVQANDCSAINLLTASPVAANIPVDVDDRCNQLALEVLFTSQAGSAGYLRFFWDGDEVHGVVEGNGAVHQVIDIVPTYGPSHHVLGIRMDPGGSVQSSVTVSNLRTRFVEEVPCLADIGRQGGVAGPDGLLDNNDFVVFIDFFFTSDLRADLGIQGGLQGQDGLLNNNDFVVFIDAFFTGCS